MNIIEQLDNERTRPVPLPEFQPGDTVKVHYRVREGQRERIQVFEGTVLQVRTGQTGKAHFTVRRVSSGVGVERVFPEDSPWIDTLEVSRRGRVRRARLYYLRERVGKKAKVKEARRTRAEVEAAEEQRARRRAARAERRQTTKTKPPAGSEE
jgi:large subunit ribosomal protein L19